MNETGRVSASDLVVNNIRSKIQRGELKVGDRLPVEADLARARGRSSPTMWRAISLSIWDSFPARRTASIL